MATTSHAPSGHAGRFTSPEQILETLEDPLQLSELLIERLAELGRSQPELFHVTELFRVGRDLLRETLARPSLGGKLAKLEAKLEAAGR